MAQTMKSLMAEFENRYATMMRENASLMADAQGKYEAALLDATTRFQTALAEAQSRAAPPTPPIAVEPAAVAAPPAAPAPPPEDVPSAVWITAPNREQLLVMNKAAAVMIMAILDRTSEVAKAMIPKS